MSARVLITRTWIPGFFDTLNRGTWQHWYLAGDLASYLRPKRRKQTTQQHLVDSDTLSFFPPKGCQFGSWSQKPEYPGSLTLQTGEPDNTGDLPTWDQKEGNKGPNNTWCLERDLSTWDQKEENLVLILEMVLEKEGSSLSPVVPIFDSFGSIFVTLFQIQEALGPVQNAVQFHLHITCSPMPEVM